MTLPPRQAYRDAEYIERQLDEAPNQLVVVADDLDYAWQVALAYHAQYETRDSAGCCVVTTEEAVTTIGEQFDQLLPDVRLSIVDVGSAQEPVWNTYTESPVYHLETVGDFTNLVLALDDASAAFDGEGALLFHSLDELLADTSVPTVLRLLTLLDGNLALTPQLYTLDLDRCSADSLETIRSRVDTLVQIENQADGTWVHVD